MTEVEETFKKIASMRGVQGVMAMSSDGVPIKTTMDNEMTVHTSYHVSRFVKKVSRMVKDLDSTNDCMFVRMHTKKNEIMCAVDPNYLMVVLQEAHKCD